GFVYYYSYKGSSIMVEFPKEGLRFWVYSPEYDPWENKKGGEEGTEVEKGQVIAKTTKIVKIEIYFDSKKELWDISLLRKFFPYI
ncbi:hypothetical protein HKBW3S42_02159, partial [Candidatus Hakubella thermalkaliphila]